MHQSAIYVISPDTNTKAGFVVCSLACAAQWAKATGTPFMIRSTRPGGACTYCVGCGIRQRHPDHCLFHGTDPCPPTDWTQSLPAAPIIRGIYQRTRQPVTAEQVSAAHDLRQRQPELSAGEVAQAIAVRRAPPTGTR